MRTAPEKKKKVFDIDWWGSLVCTIAGISALVSAFFESNENQRIDLITLSMVFFIAAKVLYR